ncbi:MAG: hypothetical protein Q7S53_03465 [bacterium]|nr:hypothetical protein [bacterium]
MNDPMNPMQPPQGPVDPMNQSFENNDPMHPVYEETTHLSKLYKIIIGVMGFVIFVLLILLIIFIVKSNDSQARINAAVEKATEKKEKEIRDACELEKKEIRENPWADFKAREDFGTFKFIVPRNWAYYEHFDINANNPYSLYFNPDMVRYDSNENIRETHAALEVTITKKLYAQEVKDLKEKIKNSKDKSATEETVNISNFTGTKFTYKDKDLGRKVGVIILPYRDRAFFIRTDDYDQWNDKYYDKFFKSFAITP